MAGSFGMSKMAADDGLLILERAVDDSWKGGSDVYISTDLFVRNSLTFLLRNTDMCNDMHHGPRCVLDSWIP